MTGALAFFGAFNPPTVAHIELARFAMERTGREKVVFVPSKSAYIRGEQGKDFAFSEAERCLMLRLAASTRPWMEICDWELRQLRQMRTYDTLCHLRDTGVRAALLFGSDKLAELETAWLHVEKICREFGIVCLERGGDDCRSMIENSAFLRALGPYITVLTTPEDTRRVSSTAVREILAAGGDAAGMVPEEIWPILQKHREEKGHEA